MTHREGGEPTALPQLYEFIEPGLLETRSRSGADETEAGFQYRGCRTTERAGDTVLVDA